MQFEPHERAHLLLDRAMVEGVSSEEERWLGYHISQCAECSHYAELCQRTIRALDSFAFDMDPAAAFRVQDAVRNCADRMACRSRDSSIGISVAIALTIIGSVGIWEPAAWLASRWNLSTPAWQIGFAILWLLPSVLLDVLLLFRRKLISDHASAQGETG